MRRRSAIAALAAALALLAVTASQAELIPQGNVLVKFNADFDPHLLPRDHAAPVKIRIQGSIATTDGTHPPPLRSLEVELNRNGQLSTEGLAVCSAQRLQSTATQTALVRCQDAVVGRGEFKAAVALGGEVATGGKIIAFNSRLGGKSALLLHFFARVPVRFTLVVPLTIQHRGKGEFGTLLRTRVPKIAAGLGSITDIDLTIGRRYGASGQRRSYVSAACGAPRGINIVPFDFARARFNFARHPQVHSTLTNFCRVRSS